MSVTKKDLEKIVQELDDRVHELEVRYSSEFNDIRNDLSGIDDNISDCGDRADDIESEVNGQETQISELVEKVEQLESDISDIILIQGDGK